MKKVFFWIFFVLAFLVSVYDMCFAVFGALDVRGAFDKLAATSGASGIDYWGVGADIFVLFVIAFSILGLVLSIISRIISYNRVT